MLEVRQGDKWFYDSPDAGDKNCICSRCGSHIPEEDSPVIRMWPTEIGDYGFDPKAKGGTEFRYCNECCKKMGVIFSQNDFEDFDPNFD